MTILRILHCVYRGVKVYAHPMASGATLYVARGRGIDATALDVFILKTIIDAALYTAVLTRRESMHAI
jgi:hypothetical protein